MIKVVIAVIVALGHSFVNSVSAKETITWFQPDFPPYVIVSEDNKSKGIDNQIVQYVIDNLPEYDHRFLVASYKRILSSLKHGKKGIVTPLFITSERQKYLTYSNIPNYLALPNGFVINKDNLKTFETYLTSAKHIDIEAVLHSGQFSIGISSGRSYYGILDEVIHKHSNSNIFFERSGADQLGVLNMLGAERVDAAFGFPVEVQYFSDILGLDYNFTTLTIHNTPLFSPVYFAAPSDKWGREIIDKINTIINREGVIERFNNYYEYWLDDKSKEHYKKLKEKYYKTSDDT